jgi:hypothetical protein
MIECKSTDLKIYALKSGIFYKMLRIGDWGSKHLSGSLCDLPVSVFRFNPRFFNRLSSGTADGFRCSIEKRGQECPLFL